jgi:alkylation response protein AidB-like acyl-CoA dehydrogenase
VGLDERVDATTIIDRTDAVLASLEALIDSWRGQRDERLRRRSLDPEDFSALADAGWLTLAVPVDHGGLWTGLPTTVIQARVLGRLARVDPGLALVISMHPAVLNWWSFPDDPPDEYADAWAAQRSEVFGSAMAGRWWGTITSEPGSGGDVLATRTTAEPVDGERGVHRLTGSKHFGSGSGVVDHMITTARVPGEELPDFWIIDAAGWPDGAVAGMRLVAAWDGSGMKSTQSHAARLDGVVARRLAWPAAWSTCLPALMAPAVTMWVSLVSAIVDSAVEEAVIRLRPRGESLRPFESAGLAQAEVDRWSLANAAAACLDACHAGDATAAAGAALRAKLAGGESAERAMSTLGRVVGGGTFSSSSPFASWYEDVRALGFLRPPWALAVDQLVEGLLEDPATP